MPQYIAGARGNRDSGIFSNDSPWAQPDKPAASKGGDPRPKGGDFLDRLAQAEARDDYHTGAQQEQERQYQMHLQQQMRQQQQEAAMRQQHMLQQQQAKHQLQMQQQQMMIAQKQQQQRYQQDQEMMAQRLSMQQVQQQQQQQQQQQRQQPMRGRAPSPRPAEKSPTPRAKKSSMGDHLGGGVWGADQPSPRNARPGSRMRGRESPRANTNAPAAGGFARLAADGHRDVNSPPQNEHAEHGRRSTISLGSDAWDASAPEQRGRGPMNGRGGMARGNSPRRAPEDEYEAGSTAALRARQKQARAFTPERRAPSPRDQMGYEERAAGAGRAHASGGRGAHLASTFEFG